MACIDQYLGETNAFTVKNHKSNTNKLELTNEMIDSIHTTRESYILHNNKCPKFIRFEPSTFSSKLEVTFGQYAPKKTPTFHLPCHNVFMYLKCLASPSRATGQY